MDTKAIVEKALKGEAYQDDIKDFTPEQLVSFNTSVKEASRLELEKVSALRKEGQRVEEKNRISDTAFSEKFRVEQINKAKSRFDSDPRFVLSDKEKTSFETEFKKLDDGSYDAELIFNNMKRTFAVVKADDLIDGRAKAAEYEKNAANFNAQMAGGSGFISAADDEKYSQPAKDLYKEWQKAGYKNKTLDQAQKIADGGTKWKDRSLAD